MEERILFQAKEQLHRTACEDINGDDVRFGVAVLSCLGG